MSKAWMPMYWGDYAADTGHLTTIQHGAYLLLIKHYWQHGGLPQDVPSLQRITGMDCRQWRSNSLAIASLFQSGWKHKRIEKELEKARILSEKRAVLGAIGGRHNRRMNNAERHLQAMNGEAIAKQTVAQSHKKDKKEVDGKELRVSLSLAETIKAKGWA